MNTRNQSRRISLLLAAALVLSGCGAEPEGAQQEASSAIAVKAVEAGTGTMTVSNQFVGTVSPQQQVSIMPLVSGEVDAVYAEVGDEVKAGDVLFHIKDDAARLQKESAELSKQGAELSAQMQLGSAQVMNNISMQSNIRSLEYQLEMAKDQYHSAVSGIADAQEAKDEMNSALDEINHSVKKLQENQSEMEAVVSEASKYIEPTGKLSGNYSYQVAYNHKKDPSHYRWSDTPETKTAEPEKTTEPTDEADQQKEAGADQQDDGNANQTGTASAEMNPPRLPSAGLPAFEQEEPTESEMPSEPETPAAQDRLPEDGTENGAQKPAEDENAGEDEGAGEDESAGEGNSADGNEQQSTTADASGEPAASGREAALSGSVQEEAADTETLSASAWFSIELVREAPLYLAEQDGYEEHDGNKPSADVTTEEAWEAYRKQQKINAAKSAAEEMGYSAEDIGSGKASEEVMENSVQIVALQYQASQLQSNQANVESSIKSAESAKDSTAKSIDFYEDNLENAQITYGISNGQAYQDTAGALATQIQAADVSVRSAQMQLEYYSPATPISGTVVSKNVEQYGLVQPGYAAYVISNQDAMNVTFAVSGRVKESLQIGMPVTLEKSGSTYTGTITEIGETVDQQSGGLFLIKAVTEADGDKLASGTAVKLTVDTFRSENTVMIPYDAVHFESEQAYVFVIADHRAVRTPVTIGLMNDDMVEVTEGLAAGTQVVATWSSQLEDGAEVRIIGESQSAADSNAAGETETESLSGEAGEADE